MKTDFSIVSRQIIMEYLKIYKNDRKGKPWSLKDCIDVFQYFYWKYKKTFGECHPHLKNATINRIIKTLPYWSLPVEQTAETLDKKLYEYEPEDYRELIDAYFSQHFDCNYSIAHFMTGDIRMLRYYETLYTEPKDEE